MIKVLLDIDVILDVLQPRPDFYLHSFSVLNLCALDEITGWVSADSYSTLHYFLKKSLGEGTARVKIFDNLQSLSVVPIRHSTLKNAAASECPDFEDNLKIASAREFALDYIITRNVRHYTDSPVKALSPEQFVAEFKETLQHEKISKVPFMDLSAQHHQTYNEIDDRMTDIMISNGFILGKHVAEFEQGFAELQGAKYCIGVSSGTDALHVALLALGIGHGDLVALPVNTFIATAEGVSLCGAEPLFIDCNEFYNIDIDGFRKHLEAMDDAGRARVKAVIPVHLYGQPVNMTELVAVADEFDIQIVEDSCQAHLAEWQGQKVGTFGAFGAFSFYPGKNLGAAGEAGALVTNDETLFERARQIRQHGEVTRYHHDVVGHNYRMEALQGAVLATKLQYIEDWTRKRRANARLYSSLLADLEEVSLPSEQAGAGCVYHLYVIRCDDREALQQHLQKHGIYTGIHYPNPLHLQKAYEELGHSRGDFPMAEKAAETILSLPMYPQLTEAQIQYVCEEIRNYYTNLA